MHHPPATTEPPIDVLGQLPVGVMLMDARGQVVHENDVLRSLWDGFDHQPADAPFPADAHSPDGRVLEPQDWPIRRSLATGEDVRGAAIELERAHDDPVSIVAESRPLLGPRGERVGAVMVVRDVTEAHDDAVLREAFLSILSHELRTPVTSIYGGVELLRTRRLDPAVERDVLQDVALEAETLQRLIDDLLVMVRVERGMPIGSAEPVHLRRIVDLAVADEQRRWADQTFRVDLPADLPPARGDDGLVRQVLRNLLSNAAKYGPPTGTIMVGAQALGEALELRVIDEGPGVAAGQDERVFELFYRGSNAARIAGSGIGLYVARVLTEAMGGSIRVVPRDHGAEFVVRLPRYVDPEGADIEAASA